MSQVVLQPYPEMNDEQFFEFCQRNRDLRIERTAQGEVIIMPPTGGETGNRNAELNGQIRNWTKEDKTGKMFDSSAGFKLPNKADRSPDAAWVTRTRLAQLSLEQKRKFIPLCPDFVVELRSPSDELEKVKAKMDEYLANGARLGWLIDPETRQVHIYRPNTPVEILDNPQQVSGDPELPGFVLELQEIWEPDI
jgi:Uma2 family endonuclease